MSETNYTQMLLEKYPENLIENVRQRLGLEEDDSSQDKYIYEMSPNRFFAQVVTWEGLMGEYHEVIKDWIKDIYKIDLNEVSDQIHYKDTE